MESVSIVRRETVPGGWKFTVKIGEGGDATQHEVVLERVFAEEITGYRFRNELDVEAFIKRSFAFLLERESKTSIFSSFNMREIMKFFPEYSYIMKSEE